jgi:hypothetical protein
MNRMNLRMVFTLFFIALYGTSWMGCGTLATSKVSSPTQAEIDAQQRDCLIGVWDGQFIVPTGTQSPGPTTEFRSNGAGSFNTDDVNLDIIFGLEDGLLESAISMVGAQLKITSPILCDEDFATSQVFEGGDPATLLGSWTLLAPFIQTIVPDSGSEPGSQIKKEVLIRFNEGSTGLLTTRVTDVLTSEVSVEEDAFTWEWILNQKLIRITWDDSPESPEEWPYFFSGSTLGLNPAARL